MRHLGPLLIASLVISLPVVAQSSHDGLLALEFMAGCWEGGAGESTTIEEIYTSPSSNVMLGTTRYIGGGTTTMFEFTLITRDSAGITLLPYPRGRPSADGFVLTEAAHGLAMFEAPLHDFPKRIIYRAESNDKIAARIDGGEGSDRVMEWRLTRKACPGN